MDRLVLKAKLWLVIVGIAAVLGTIGHIYSDHLAQQQGEKAKNQCIKDVIGKRKNHQLTLVESRYCDSMGKFVYGVIRSR